MRIARWAFTVFLITPLTAPLRTASAMPRQQDDSLAAAARRAAGARCSQLFAVLDGTPQALPKENAARRSHILCPGGERSTI